MKTSLWSLQRFAFDNVVWKRLYWLYLVAFWTEGDSCLVVVLFTSQGNVTRSTLEATAMVCPVQGFYRWFRKSHRFPTEATHLWVCTETAHVNISSNHMCTVNVETFQAGVVNVETQIKLPLLSWLMSWPFLWILWEFSSGFNPLEGVLVSTFEIKHTVNVKLNFKLTRLMLEGKSGGEFIHGLKDNGHLT